MWRWFVDTLRQYPELAIFLALGLGYLFGKLKVGKFTLGPVTGVLLAAVLVGQLNVEISGPVKAVFFLLFIFAIGYSVGPQFINGFKSNGVPQILFATIQCVLSLVCALAVAAMSGLDAGFVTGIFAGGSTISASLGMATDALNNSGLPPDQIKTLSDHMPVAYAVTYIFGTIGSAWVLAYIMPRFVAKDLVAEARELEKTMSIPEAVPANVRSAWDAFELRAYRVPDGGPPAGTRIADAEARVPDSRVFIERIRRDGEVLEPSPNMVLRAGDIVAVGGHRDALATHLGNGHFEEVDDHDLLDLPVETLDAVVTDKRVAGQTIAALRADHRSRGVYLNKVMRGRVEVPILDKTEIHRGDVLTLTGRRRHVDDAAAALGYADRPTELTDMIMVGLGILAGGLVGAVVIEAGGVPLTLSTTGGALLAGIVLGWLRSVHPVFGRIPMSTQWFMNSVGLNVFIAVVGITAGPGFVSGLKEAGVSLFLWGIFVTTVPLILGSLIARYLFKFPSPIALGCSAGARTTTASLQMIQDVAKSKTPALGYTITYAVGNTLLTIWGMVIIMLLA